MRHFYRLCLGTLVLFLSFCAIIAIIINYELVWNVIVVCIMLGLAYAVGLSLTYKDDDHPD